MNKNIQMDIYFILYSFNITKYMYMFIGQDNDENHEIVI